MWFTRPTFRSRHAPSPAAATRFAISSGRTWTVASLLVAAFVWTQPAWAQLPVPASSQFDITGFLQAATLNNAADSKSGGTLTVNGHLITVPSNLIVILPANALTWQELFAKAPAPYGLAVGGNGQSGLAMSDTPRSLVSFSAKMTLKQWREGKLRFP